MANFLQGVGAEFPNYISKTPSDEIYETTEIGSIPAVMVFGADGKVVKIFADIGETAGFTYDKDVIPLVKQLLNS